MSFSVFMAWVTAIAMATMLLSWSLLRLESLFDKAPVGEIPSGWALLCVAGLFVSMVALIAAGVVALGFEAYAHGEELVDSAWLAPGLVLSAVALFYLKKRLLFAYGTIEIAAATGVIAFVAFTNQGSTSARLASAATATYFLIRGLDNLSNSETAKTYFKRWGWFPQRGA